MVEPQQSVGNMLFGLLVAAVGCITGDYVSILVGAFAGAMWPLLGATTGSRSAGAILFLKLVLTACALTSPLAYALDASQSVPISHSLCPIAFLIAVMGERWVQIFDSVAKGAVAVVEAFITRLIKMISNPSDKSGSDQ